MSKIEDSKFSAKAKTKKNQYPGANLSKLGNARIIQKHLVYVIGLSSNLANKEILIKQEYFGQYGSIAKIVVNKTKAYNPHGPNGPSYSAYVSYNSHHDASLAILAIDDIEVDGHTLRASFGTTKYCTFYLKNSECPNKDCLYLHYLADPDDIIHRDDMSTNKNIFYEQQLLAMKIADIFNPEIKRKLISPKKYKTGLPSTDTVYAKEIVMEQDPGQEYENKTSKHNYYNTKKYEYEDYDNYDGDYYNDYDNHKSDEVEYVLVREKSDRYRKKYPNKYSHNVMNDLQDDNSNKREDKSQSPTNNTSDNGHTNSNTSGNEGCMDRKENKNNSEDDQGQKLVGINPVKNIYRKSDKSRFEFVNDNTKKELKKDVIPEFVSEMLYKKISTYTFFKKFTCVKDKKNDINFFEKILKDNNNSWAQFIKSNLSNDK